MEKSNQLKGIALELPERPVLVIKHLILDFNGTLALDGSLLPGVSEKLILLSGKVNIMIVTADTYGTAEQTLKGLPITLKIVNTSRDKAALLTDFANEGVVAIGNGRNDVEMFRRASLSIGILGPEGIAADLISASSVVVRHIDDAFDLLLNPARLRATLRA